MAAVKRVQLLYVKKLGTEDCCWWLPIFPFSALVNQICSSSLAQSESGSAFMRSVFMKLEPHGTPSGLTKTSFVHGTLSHHDESSSAIRHKANAEVLIGTLIGQKSQLNVGTAIV